MPVLKLVRVLCAAALACALSGPLRAGEQKPQPELRTVEVFVPYDEFMKVVGKERDATVMSLEEYRTLVELAIARGTAKKDTPLPPVQAALVEAVYTGTAQDAAVRFDVAFKVVAAAKEWARCELGPPLPGLGRITLDSEPGWVVTDKGRAYLLVKGAGTHTGTLSFTLAPQKEEDVEKIAGALLSAGSAVLRLDVSGRAAALDQPLPCDTVFDEARNVTRFSLALGRSGQLAFAWRRRHDAQKNEVLLLAEHRISYLLERASPAFRWHARVTIARRKTDELLFTEPPGARVVRLTGPDVHSWHRAGDSLRVLLEKPMLGNVEIEAEGLLPAAPGACELGCPGLKGAREDTRYVAIFEPTGSRIVVAQTTGLRELALNEVAMPQLPGGRLARLYLAEQAEAKVVVSDAALPVIFDTQTVLTAVIDERQALLRALIAVQPEQGRVYSVALRVPAPWALDIGELREHGTKRGVKAEMSKDGDAELWTLSLTDAADAAHRLEFGALFKLRDLAWGEAEWPAQGRPFNFATPAVEGARRSVVHLGVSVYPSIEITFGAMPAWRTEAAGKLEQLGVSEAKLRAGLVSEKPGSEVRMELARKTPRGNYDLVTHVLAMEREVWVRSDVELAIVDRAVEELAVNLQGLRPDDKDPLYVTGPEIKEIVLGTAPGERRVRFNQPWQGVRMLRVEYRVPLAADTDMPVPDMRVAGNFDSRRRVVFQGAGVVELEMKPGPGLEKASLEDTPEFARPFRSGRGIAAFTFAVSGESGAFHALVRKPSPTLNSVASKLELTTVLDAAGVARTHAVYPKLYGGQQYLWVKLPGDATLEALCVGDQNVRPVRKAAGENVIAVPLPPGSCARVEIIYERRTGAWGSFGSCEEVAPDLQTVPVGVTDWQVYYPAEYAVTVSAGNVAPETAAPPQFFASSFWWNLLRGRCPRWTAWESPASPRPVSNALAPKAGASSGQRAQPQRQSQQLVPVELAARADAAKDLRASGLAVPEGTPLKAGKLGGSASVVLAYRDLVYSRFVSRAVFFAAALIGLWLARRPSKRALFHYVLWGMVLGTVIPPALNWESPLLLVPFCEGLSLVALCVLGGLAWRGLQWLRQRRAREAGLEVTAAVVLLVVAAGAACAGESDPVLVPYPKDTVPVTDPPRKTTKVYVPKAVFLDLMSRANPAKADAAQGMPHMDDRKNVGLASAGATASGGNSPEYLTDGKLAPPAWTNWQKGEQFVVTLRKEEQVEMIRILLWQGADRYSRYKLEVSADGTTYTTVADRTQGYYNGWQTEAIARQAVKSVRLTGTFDSGSDGRFYVGEIEVLTPPTPIAMALGNALYELSAAEKTYRCKGTLDVITFDPKGWVTVPLDFGASQLVGLSVDGQPAQVGEANGVPFVQLQGAGKHKLEMELQGPLSLSPGRAQLEAKFVTGSAARLVAVLPSNVEVDPKGLPAGSWVVKDAAGGTQRCEVDLGAAGGQLHLSWRSPDIRGKGATQFAARSYEQLQLGPDGYGVYRVDRVTIDGSGADQLAFKVLGVWDLASVVAGDLAEWTVTGEGEQRRLRLWFQKPVNQVLIQVNGWAPLGGDETQVAALSLENATRQEGFIGLQHGDGRRFTARSLEGLKRASSQELAAMFTLPPGSLPDRIYRWLEPPAKHAVSVETEPGQAAIETQLVGVVRPDRLVIGVRSRYTASGRTPARHEVELPPGWEVRACRSNAMSTWEVLEIGGTKRLVVYFAGRAASGTEVIWSAEQALVMPPGGPLVLELPQPRALADARTTEALDWVLAADQSLALSQGAATTMQNLPLDRAPAWVRLEGAESYQFAYRSLKPGSRLAVEVSRRASIGTATVVSFIRAAEDYVQINTRCRFRIEQAGRDRFVLKLPAGAQLVSLSARNLRGKEVTEQPDGLLLTALLQSPVAGEQIIDVSYRLKRDADKDVVIGPLGVEDKEFTKVEHYVGLVRVEGGLVMVTDKKGLTKPLDSEELPFVPEKLSAAALIEVFEAGPAWSLTLRQPELKLDTGQDVEVGLAEIKTVIAADGVVRSVATYTVRNRALQFLPVAMPPDATLWGVLVDGEPAAVAHEQQGARKVLLIPVPRLGETDLPIEVALVYESPRLQLPAAYRLVTPLAPEVIGTKVVQTYWQVFVPEQYEVRQSGAKMEEVAGSVLVGGRLRTNIEDLKRLMKVADDPANAPLVRRKALRNVGRLRQDLDDRATVLQNVGGLVDAQELSRIGRDNLEVQIAGNSAVQREAGKWQQTVNSRQKDIEEAQSAATDTEQQRAFLDGFSFLGNDWRGGKRYKQASVGTPRATQGDIPVSALLNLPPFAGYGKGELPPAPAARVTQMIAPLPPRKDGLPEDVERRFQLEVSATDLRVPERGQALTFRCVEINPELTLSLRSAPATWRSAAWLALALLAAGAVVVVRRARKQTTRA